MKFFNRVRVFTATEGTGTLTLGSAFSDAFLTLAEAGGAENDETVFVIEEGDDFELVKGTVGASAGSISRDTVRVSKIDGVVGTAKMVLGGNATVRFCESAEDWNGVLAELVSIAGVLADLKDPAFAPFGTTAGTVAAGDHSHDHFSATNNPHEVTKAHVGLGNVDNTSDADKPVSTAQQAALDDKLDKAFAPLSEETEPTDDDLFVMERASDGLKRKVKAENLPGGGGGAGAPTGAFMWFAAAAPPDGWLVCDGSAVSRTTYADLFSVIGTTFGNGDGSTTFNIPDLRGEFVRGWDNGRGVDSGRSFGSSQGQRANNLADVDFDNGSTLSNDPVTVPEDGSFSDWISTNQGSSGGGNRTRLRFANRGGETRPRNVALLPCIKY